MKSTATLTLIVLLFGSIGASVYLFLDQKEKNKRLIADKNSTIATQGKLITAKDEKEKQTDAELVAAKKSLVDNESAMARLKSDNELLQVKITVAESKLTTQANGTSEATVKLQEEMDALKLDATAKAGQLADMEAKNSSLETQVADHLDQITENTAALVKAEASLKPFEEIGKTPDEIKKGLMKRPVTISKPLPPRPAKQAGKITERIQIPTPAPVPAPVPITPTSPKQP